MKVKKIWWNPFIIIGVVFVIWMYFFDDNSLRIHRELNDEIQRLEASVKYYESEIAKDKKIIELYQSDDSLEKFAREKYGLKKENEDVYIIQEE